MEITAVLTDPTFEIFAKLVVALLLGMSLGVERAIAGKTAGMRTYGLVTMGSALFVIIAVIAAGGYSSPQALVDSIRFTSQVLPGIGFIGAGLIFFKGEKVSGVTTAAGIWVAAGIGVAIGYGLYMLAAVAAVFVLLVFTGFWYIEDRLKTLAHFEPEEQ
ncbi:MAG: MgtC/SapB family protein [Minisyncoccota bacterium]